MKSALAAEFTLVWVVQISQTVLVLVATQTYAKIASHRASTVRSAGNVRDTFVIKIAFLSTRCDSCKKNCCDDCEEEYEYDWPYCTDCGDRFCDDCNEKKGTDAIQICDGCDTSCCGDCRVSICKEEESNEKCGGCFQLAGPLLLEEVKKVQKENTEVKAENKTLKDQIGGLKDYNNFLKEQLRWAQVKEQSRK